MSTMPDALFNERGQDAEYQAWRQAHPRGFVLNWPKSGCPGVTRVVFHRVACPTLKRTLTIPQWQKVCFIDFDRLIEWIKCNDTKDASSGVHPCIDCFPGGRAEIDAELSAALADEPPAIDHEEPERVQTTVLRIVRDTALARRIKRVHRWTCQLCEEVIDLPNGGRYAEAHHLKPLGGKHGGRDIEENILCLCPTCHARLDYGVMPLKLEEIRTVSGHSIGPEFIAYHNDVVFGRNAELLSASSLRGCAASLQSWRE